MQRIFDQGRALAAATVLLVASGSGGCGRKADASADGGGGSGDGGLTFPDARVDGTGTISDAFMGAVLSFDVIAVPTGAFSRLPSMNTFTLVLDVDAGLAIAGGNGGGAVVGVTTADGRTFRSSTEFSVGGDLVGAACSGVEYVRYDSIEVTIAGSTLTGTASGVVNTRSGDFVEGSSFAATLTGTADATKPTLRGGATSNPFQNVRLSASEPLPVSATAKLVVDDGAVIDLVPAITDSAIPVITGFYYPARVLRAGQGYSVSLTGLVDFAGLKDPASPSLRLGTIPAAPVALEDGFESVTGTAFGGAMVVTTGGPLSPIAGQTSLYVGAGDVPGIDSSLGRSLLVRLSRQPGDTKVRLSYRVIASAPQAAFAVYGGGLWVGSEGASAGEPVGSFGDATGQMEMVVVGGQTAYRGPATVKEAPLPADATDSVLVAVSGDSFPCPGPPRTKVGLLIDDIRLE